MNGAILGRPIGRKHIEVRRRTHRLAPGVIGLSLVMIFATFVFVVMPTPAFASSTKAAGPACIQCPAPNQRYCYPNCSPPPPPKCNPTLVAIQFSSVQTSVRSTNVTITWQESPNFSNTSTYLDWGNTTTYSYSQSVGYSSTYSVFLDFLQPQTHYYFEIQADPNYKSCTLEYVTGSYSSSFTTAAEATYVSQYGAVIRGVVHNANGNPAPAGLEVEVQCTVASTWFQYAFTNAQGAYSITPSFGASGCQNVGHGYYVVGVENYVNVPSPGNPSIQWLGYWNESMVIWAVQFVNFYLPLNFVGPYIPETLDFSNAPTNYGTITYQQAFTTTETLTHEWSVSGGAVLTAGASDATEVTYSYSSGGGPYANGGTLDWGAEWWTAGSLLYNSIYRSWNVTSMSTYRAYSDGFSSQYGVAIPPNDFQPGKLKSDAYYLKDSNGVTMQNVPEPANKGYTGTIETSTSVATSYSFSIGVSLSANLPGAQTFNFNAQTSWTQTSSSTYSQDLQFTIGGPQAACYDVFGEAGNPGSTPETSDMIGVYYWAPQTIQNGVPVCTGG